MRDEAMKGRPHEKLEVYRIAHQLAVRVHAVTMELPKHEMYEEGSQVRRSSKSISSQIVEGHALRAYKGEYLHYLARAYASAEESVEHLTYLKETLAEGCVQHECTVLIGEYGSLCRKLFNYSTAVQKQHKAGMIREGIEYDDDGE